MQITQVYRDGTVAPVLVSAIPFVDREADSSHESTVGNEHILYFVLVFSELPAVFDGEADPAALANALKGRQQDILLIDPNIYGSPVVNVSDEFAANFLGDRQKAINDLIKNSDGGGYLLYLRNNSSNPLVVSQISEALRLRTQYPNARLNKDGTVQLVHLCPVRDEAGHVPYFVCVHADVTDEDRAASSPDASSFPLARAAIARREECRAKAQAILKDRAARYEDDHALILCRHYDFSDGLLFLLEKLEFYNDILEYYMEYSSYSDIVAFALKKGGEDPSLWMKVVRYFAKEDRAEEMEQVGLAGSPHHRNRGQGLGGRHSQCSSWRQVLEILEREKLLSPLQVATACRFWLHRTVSHRCRGRGGLQVVQLLGEDSTCKIELVRDFLIRTFQSLSEEQAEDEKAISEHESESERIRAATLNNQCIVKGDAAAKVDAQMEKLAQKQSSGKALHTEFNDKMASCSSGLGSGERFSTVAEYFSYGLFDRVAGSSAAAAADDY